MNNSLKEKMEFTASRTEDILKAYFSSSEPERIGYKKIVDAQLYSLLAGGKRVRPFLVTEFARLFAKEGAEDCSAEASLPLAAAIEMIHTFSLIHDDLPCMDNDVLRRGKNTCHVEFDEATALLAGDALSIAAFEIIADSELSLPQIKRAVKVLSSAAGWKGMIAGQVLDLKGETTRLSYEELHDLHLLKTGKLIECACALGCIAANVEENDQRYKDALSYAAGIGLAFQITDDILDRTGSTKELGKTIGKDESSNKTTFLTYRTLEEARSDAKEITRSAVAAVNKYSGAEDLVEFAYYLTERKN